jgi:hypothetical protein
MPLDLMTHFSIYFVGVCGLSFPDHCLFSKVKPLFSSVLGVLFFSEPDLLDYRRLLTGEKPCESLDRREIGYTSVTTLPVVMDMGELIDKPRFRGFEVEGRTVNRFNLTDSTSSYMESSDNLSVAVGPILPYGLPLVF